MAASITPEGTGVTASVTPGGDGHYGVKPPTKQKKRSSFKSYMQSSGISPKPLLHHQARASLRNKRLHAPMVRQAAARPAFGTVSSGFSKPFFSARSSVSPASNGRTGTARNRLSLQTRAILDAAPFRVGQTRVRALLREPGRALNMFPTVSDFRSQLRLEV